MKGFIQYTISIIVFIGLIILEPTEEILNPICLGFILIFGIPHGAIDHKIYFSTSKEKRNLAYIVKYVGISIGFVAWWIFMPFKALVLFIILSAYHFGQELLEENGYKGRDMATCLIWGFIILLIPFFLRYDDLLPFIESIGKVQLPPLPLPTLIGIVSVISLLGLITLWKAYKNSNISFKSCVRLLVFGLFVQTCYLYLPFLAAFSIYFLLFHSLNAFSHQYQWIAAQTPGYSVKRFIKDLSLFSVIALIGLILILWLIQPLELVGLIGYFFMFTSLLTLPHAIVFDQFYEVRKEKGIIYS